MTEPKIAQEITKKLVLVSRNCSDVALVTCQDFGYLDGCLASKSRREDIRSAIETAEESLMQVKKKLGELGITYSE